MQAANHSRSLAVSRHASATVRSSAMKKAKFCPSEKSVRRFYELYAIAAALLSSQHRGRRLAVSFAAGHDGPGDPGDLVGQGNGGQLGRPARHQPPQPRVLIGAVLEMMKPYPNYRQREVLQS